MKRFVTALLTITTLALSLTACSSKDHEYNGYITADYLYLSSNYEGQLIESFVKRGDSITSKEKLCQLDTMPQIQWLNQYKDQFIQQKELYDDMLLGQRDPVIQGSIADIKQSEAKLRLATISFQRAKKLYAAQAISAQTYDIALALYESTKEKVTESKASLENNKLGSRHHQIQAQKAAAQAAAAQAKAYQWELQQKTISAPTNGIVFDVYYKPGEHVPAGSPILSMIAPQYIYAEFYVQEKDLSQLKLGQNIQFTCDGCKTTGTATINYISSTAEYTPPVIYSNQSRSKLVYQVKAALPLKTALTYHPGQPIQISIQLKG